MSSLQKFCWKMRSICASVGMACLCLVAPVVVAEQDVDFARDVAPIFEQHCVRCHSSLTDRGDLSLETAAGLKQMQLVVPGDPDGSSLLDVITAADGQKPRMPEQGPPVPADQVAMLRRWIQQGAVWPADVVVRERSKAGADWWSLQPLQQKFFADSIDQFIDARLTEH
jgi:mono/diheme cytochrome c family protein